MRIRLKDPNEFKKILILKGYSQTDLAKAIDVTPPYVNQILNQERCPSAKSAKKISYELELSFEEIFFIDEDNKSYQA